MSDDSVSQWTCLLQNLGVWQGSFTRLSAQGAPIEDFPSLVTLQELDDRSTVRQTIQRFAPTGELVYDRVLEYSSLNRSILLFKTGEFSQGSIQFAPFSEFGAELGFIQGDRRLRLVQMFDTNSQLATLTLIRERRQGTPAAERPPLTVESLVGDWQGEAVTIYPDWRSPTRSTSHLQIRRLDNQLTQQLTSAGLNLTSHATLESNSLRFEQGKHPIQVLLLPDGASSTTPLSVPRGQPFFLEAGWLVHEKLRQRMIRSYDAQGGWSSLTLVTEQKVDSERS